MAFPSWLTQLEFQVNVLPMAAGVLAATLAAEWTLNRPNWRGHTGAALALAFAIGAYQSFLFFYLVVGVGLVIDGLFGFRPKRQLIDLSIRFFGLAGLGTVLWYLILQGFEWGFDKNPSSYSERFQRIDLLFDVPYFVIAKAAYHLILAYVLAWRAFDHTALVFGLTVLVPLCVLLTRLDLHWQRRLAAGILLAALLAMPFTMNLITGGALPLRTYLAVPLVIWLLLILAHRHSDRVLGKRLLAGLAIMTAVSGLFVQATVQARAWAVHQRDTHLALQIDTRAMAIFDTALTGPIAIDFHGQARSNSIYAAIPTATAGASFFEWDRGNPDRMVRWMNFIGYDRYVPIPHERRRILVSHYADMAVWPGTGSVRWVDGVILVKLSK